MAQPLCSRSRPVPALTAPPRIQAPSATWHRLGQTVQCAASTSTAATSKSGTAVAPTAPYKVVVTGSTKGIGRALAEEFLRNGDSVVVCSRSGERVDTAVNELVKEFGRDRVKGRACNVARPADVKALADFAKRELGRVDIWINNAGTNAYRYGPLAEADDAELVEIVETNVLGVMLCCREAVRVMRDQPTVGHLFNMDGAGADGSPTPRFAAYGATKRGLQQLGGSIAAELKMLGIKNVGVHNLSPGMVTTELLMAGADTPTSKFFINCLAEPSDEVARYLVPRVRQVPAEAQVNPFTGVISSTYIQYLTKPKAYRQILMRLITGERKNRHVNEE